MIRNYDDVLLTDGRLGTVMETLGGGEAFLVDVGSEKEGWDNIYVERKDIVKAVPKAPSLSDQKKQAI